MGPLCPIDPICVLPVQLPEDGERQVKTVDNCPPCVLGIGIWKGERGASFTGLPEDSLSDISTGEVTGISTGEEVGPEEDPIRVLEHEPSSLLRVLAQLPCHPSRRRRIDHDIGKLIHPPGEGG